MKKFTIEPNQYKKMVSILIPTRNRMIPSYHNDGFAQEGGLIPTLESIYKNTEHRDGIEIILRVDNDDVNTLDNLNMLDKYDEVFDIKLLKGDRYGGYKDIWRFFNELSEAAEGEFLIPFSDDETMETFGWDSILAEHTGKVGIVKSDYSGDYDPIDPVVKLMIPCIHSKIIELQGSMAFHESMDLKWDIWNELAKQKGYNFEIPEPRFEMKHDCMGGEHVRDGLPPSDPGGVVRFTPRIKSDLQRVIDGLEVA
tara:strand:+ start:441 stop:1202 length:762 start_codon:yes stop_codon:yes gene_type:complete